MAKPNRTLRQSKAPTPAQVRHQKDKIAEQKTQQMADAAYRRAYRHAQVAMVLKKTLEPGSTGRRLRVEYTNQLLAYAVQSCGADSEH